MIYEKKVIRPEYRPKIDKLLKWYIDGNDLIASVEPLNGFRQISRDDAADVLFAQSRMPEFIDCMDENESDYVILKCGDPDDVVFEGCDSEDEFERIMNVGLIMNYAYSHASGAQAYIDSLNSGN